MKSTRKIRRQQVKDTVATVSPWDLSGTPEEICKELRDTQDAYLKDYNDVIDAHWVWECAYAGDGEGYFALSITRLENDREYNDRVKRLMKIKEGEKLEKAKQEQTEYETYLRLQKKFGNKDNLPRLDYDEWKKGWSKP